MVQSLYNLPNTYVFKDEFKSLYLPDQHQASSGRFSRNYIVPKMDLVQYMTQPTAVQPQPRPRPDYEVVL
jgi:hypothetical protein